VHFPETQLLEAHVALVVHDAPTPVFATHAPWSQYAPSTHASLFSHGAQTPRFGVHLPFDPPEERQNRPLMQAEEA